MHCFACNNNLPTNPSDNLDVKTGRMYCVCCGEEINNLYMEMYMKPKKQQEDTAGEVPILDEEFDDPDYVDVFRVPTEEDYEEFNLPPENYDE